MTDGAVDWYDCREDLRPGDQFLMKDGSYVELDRRVPGDGTQWYVADWCSGGWAHYDSTIEPGDLLARVEDDDELVGEVVEGLSS